MFRGTNYNEFCGPLGIDHLSGGMAATGPAQRFGFGLHRPAGAPRFSEAERSRVAQLRVRLSREAEHGATALSLVALSQ